ncbi:MAG: AAA family ATPase [Clostridiales bacterium]|nr:AAA family ATPase [Clostridiales bacterium]
MEKLMEKQMEDVFITKIHIGKVRHLENFDITLSDTERKHLIITGINGSGKTALLEALRDCVSCQQRDSLLGSQEAHDSGLASITALHPFPATPKRNVSISCNKDFEAHKLIFAYMSALRSKVEVPGEVALAEIEGRTLITHNASKLFLKRILYLYVQYISSKVDGSPESEELKAWFDNFTSALRYIYDSPLLELKPDMKRLSFNIKMPGRELFALHEMSDGYEAFLNICMELILRFENPESSVDYKQSAIVFIDEVETHLHVSLQRKALPFLTRMFPNVQFIVTTHSPFVISSLENAVVYDLETRMILENAFAYPCDSIVEGYLDSSLYSEIAAGHFAKYKELAFKTRTIKESREFMLAIIFLDKLDKESELYACYQGRRLREENVILPPNPVMLKRKLMRNR